MLIPSPWLKLIRESVTLISPTPLVTCSPATCRLFEIVDEWTCTWDRRLSTAIPRPPLSTIVACVTFRSYAFVWPDVTRK
uniref:Putative secreted protein n=1 Tax=Anopheles triannulatus TaxID=58253 RepID=A0A2M4B3F2_9DIPT